MIQIRQITAVNQEDIRLKNEPFKLFGKLRPFYQDEEWSYETEYFSEDRIEEMCFPDENYDFNEMSDSLFLGAYDGEDCIGLAILQPGFFKYMYLYDLKVASNYRGQKVGRLLIQKAKEIASQQGYCGIYTQGQDNNLGACLFYLAMGFVIGGIDTTVYRHTAQEGKTDILFYLEA